MKKFDDREAARKRVSELDFVPDTVIEKKSEADAGLCGHDGECLRLAAGSRAKCASRFASNAGDLPKGPESFINRILFGDCISVLERLPGNTVDLVVTDPPYLVNYRSRDGRSVLNDVSSEWVRPAFAGIHRVLKDNRFCISFYGWNRVGEFMRAWRQVGFRPVGHLVFKKDYASSKRFLNRCHELAYLLAKGQPALPEKELSDVLPWEYSGNRLHPTQKPVGAIRLLISTFSKPRDIVLDPFCGSGTTALAAKLADRRYIGIEKDLRYHRIAVRRLAADSASEVTDEA